MEWSYIFWAGVGLGLLTEFFRAVRQGPKIRLDWAWPKFLVLQVLAQNPTFGLLLDVYYLTLLL